MVSPIGYGSYNSYINSYFIGRNQGSGSVNAISPINRVRPANSSTLLPLDTPQQARLTTALRDVRNMFSQLKTAATSLQLGKTGNVFDKRIVDTTNSAAVTATAKDKAKQTDYAIGVSKLAQSQQNRGTAFEATSNASVAGFTVGENKFLLTHGTTSTQLSFTVKAGDNTKTTLSNMASSINNAKTGVTAQVMNSTVDGITNSRLVLTGDKTGTDNAFSLADETGNAVAKSGAGVRSVEAENAQYSVNGIAQNSQSNLISLDNDRVAVTLKAVTSQATSLTVKPDSNSITKSVIEFVNTYNNTIDALRDNSDILRNKTLQTFTRSAVNNRDSLAAIGITVKADKTLAVDVAKLEKASTNSFDRLARAIGGTAGLANQSARVANTLIPEQASEIPQLSQYRYNNMSAMISQMYSVGNLVDGYM